ncbi:hypothetical protein BH10BAC1_BH10BAC1_14570 [soil metagenome]
MNDEQEKVLFESRVYWDEVILLPVLIAFIIGIPAIIVAIACNVPSTKVFIISYLILIVTGVYISAKFFIRKYIFYENRLEIIFIYKTRKNRIIWYDDICEVYYWRGEMPKTSSRMILKLKEGKSKGIDIQEKYAQNIMLALKKKNIPVELKVRTIYNKFS